MPHCGSSPGRDAKEETIPLDEKTLSKIRLRALPKTKETASKVAGELRKRYDLFFLHLDTQVPARLTSIIRWAVSTSKIPQREWKAPIPTSTIEEYLAENPDVDSGSSSEPQGQKKDWKLEVDKFISKCGRLDQERRRSWSELAPADYGLPRKLHRKPSRASSMTSSISEGHVSPDEDGPSRKVLHYDDWSKSARDLKAE